METTTPIVPEPTTTFASEALKSQPAKENTQRSWWIGGFLLLVLLTIGALGFYWYRQQSSSQTQMTDVETDMTVTTQPTLPPWSSEVTPTSGAYYATPQPQAYTDTQGIYNISYPGRYVLSRDNDTPGIQLVLVGPSQMPQLAFSDGVLITIDTVDLGSQTLEAWVDNSIKNETSDGSITVIEAPTATIFNTYPAVRYTTNRSILGPYKTWVVQKDTNSSQAVKVVTLMYDPTNQGFQAEMDGILSSLQLLK